MENEVWKKQILVVEDHLINREILCEILKEQYRVLEAENGQEALEVLEQYREDIALILLDVMMPVMDGYTFLDRMKETGDLAFIPVIVMTQRDSEDDEVSALAHGATDFVPKPYRPQVILHRVASIIKLQETASMVNQFRYDRLTGNYSKEFFYSYVKKCLENNPEEEFRGQNLLLVDENAEYRDMVRRALEKKYRIYEVSDTHSALVCLEEKGKEFSTVILSMTLPDQGGFKILSAIRESQVTWRIPVLATGSQDEILEEQALRADADDYVCRAQTPYSLNKRVTRLLGLMAYQKRECQLMDEANRDYLTGLLNRRGLDMVLENLHRSDMPAALYLYDLDELKKMNDEYGHEAGDLFLRAFADLLRQNTRDTDILVRYGGDEFVVILKGIPSEEVALKKGEKISAAFRSYQIQNQFWGSCTAGIVFCSEEENLSIDTIRLADEALYHAKKEKKGSCFIIQK